MKNPVLTTHVAIQDVNNGGECFLSKMNRKELIQFAICNTITIFILEGLIWTVC